MHHLIGLKTTAQPLLMTLTLLCLELLPTAQAVVPPPDGGYPNFTTAEGTKALQNLTTGSANTAVGWFSLESVTTGSFNTATGAGSLLFNTADDNTAFGAAALLFNTTGYENTAPTRTREANVTGPAYWRADNVATLRTHDSWPLAISRCRVPPKPGSRNSPDTLG